jgi:hypothetical protein
MGKRRQQKKVDPRRPFYSLIMSGGTFKGVKKEK